MQSRPPGFVIFVAGAGLAAITRGMRARINTSGSEGDYTSSAAGSVTVATAPPSFASKSRPPCCSASASTIVSP